jgi:ZF-HD class homeobox domain-containing protein
METNMSTTTLGYNRDSSSSSPPQNHTLIFNNQTQFSHNNLHPDPDLTVTTTIPPPQQQQQVQQTKTCYRECLRNHAASMGSHVVDGCGEFMPSGEEGTPQSFLCAACNCHRNFHRKHVQQPQQQQQQTQNVENVYVPNFHTPSSSSQRFSQQAIVVPPLMMNFGSGAAESSSEDLNISGAEFSIQNQQQKKPVLKKRIRTKFSQEQKDRMMEFGEKIGWKIQKHDEHEVQQFCSQVGIKRHVFKVWMHNNKQALKKQQQQQQM